MKPLILLPLCSVIAAGTTFTAIGQAETNPAPAAAESPASDARPESELRSTGIAFSVEEETLLLTPENVKIPLSFVRTTVTPLVDENGKAVAWDQIRVGVPLTVQYTNLGDRMVATKVVVTRYMVEGGKEVAAVDDDGKKRAELALIKHIKDLESVERAKALPVTGGGTIMGFEQVIAVSDGTGGDVTQYVVNNSTQYLTPGGKPVAPGLVRTGVRVDVKYVENSGRKIATQMILFGLPAQGAALGTTGGQAIGGQNGSGITTNGTTAAQSGLATTAGSGATAATAWVDQFGNIIPGTLETGFINPPVTVLPNLRPGAGSGASHGNTSPNSTAPANQQQPGQPNATPQPGTTQPGTRAPSTGQPATRPAATPSSSPSSPPAPAPAPGR